MRVELKRFTTAYGGQYVMNHGVQTTRALLVNNLAFLITAHWLLVMLHLAKGQDRYGLVTSFAQGQKNIWMNVATWAGEYITVTIAATLASYVVCLSVCLLVFKIYITHFIKYFLPDITLHLGRNRVTFFATRMVPSK